MNLSQREITKFYLLRDKRLTKQVEQSAPLTSEFCKFYFEKKNARARSTVKGRFSRTTYQCSLIIYLLVESGRIWVFAAAALIPVDVASVRRLDTTTILFVSNKSESHSLLTKKGIE